VTQPAFLFVRARVLDPKQFALYVRGVGPLTAKYGGHYRVLGGTQTVLEGDWTEDWRIVISEWPSREAALTFWNSSEYVELKKLREGAAEATVLLLDGQASIELDRA